MTVSKTNESGEAGQLTLGSPAGESQPPYFVAIDLGGTSIRAAVGDKTGKFISILRCPTEAAQGSEAVIQRIIDLGQSAIAAAKISSTSVVAWACGVPGPIDAKRGIVYTPPNLPGWIEVPLGPLMTKQTHVPVYINNDANLAALGEHMYGAGHGYRNMVYMTVSTGIGGGVIINDQLFVGPHGTAGEIGHMTIDLNGPLCKCGNIGCLEVLASGPSLARIATARLEAGEGPDSVLRSAASTGNQLTGADVVKGALAGDPLSSEVFAGAMRALAAGVVNLTNLFDPEVIVIGGGVSHAGSLMFDPVRAAVRRHALPSAGQKVQIVPARLGDDMGLYGSLALAQRGGDTGTL